MRTGRLHPIDARASTRSGGRSSTAGAAGWRRCSACGPRRCSATGAPAALWGIVAGGGARSRYQCALVRHRDAAGRPRSSASGLRPGDRDDARRDPGHDADPDADRPRGRLDDPAARAGRQRGGQTRPGRSRDAARRAGLLSRPARASRGCAPLLDRRTFRLTDSELERRFLPTRAAGRAAGAADRDAASTGSRSTSTGRASASSSRPTACAITARPAQQARDRQRDQAHTAAGLTQLRFTHAQVFRDPVRVGQTLRAVVRRLEVAERPEPSPRAPGA